LFYRKKDDEEYLLKPFYVSKSALNFILPEMSESIGGMLVTLYEKYTAN